jgi:hypothetical protein
MAFDKRKYSDGSRDMDAQVTSTHINRHAEKSDKHIEFLACRLSRERHIEIDKAPAPT